LNPSFTPIAVTSARAPSATSAPRGASHHRRRLPAASAPCTVTAPIAASSPAREPVSERQANTSSQISTGAASSSRRRSTAAVSRARRAAHQAQAKATGSAISR